MKHLSFYLLLSVVFMVSCSDDFDEEYSTGEALSKTSILSFPTKEEFNSMVSGNDLSPDTKSLDVNSGRYTLSKGESLFEQDFFKEEMSQFVPNEKFAKLLNKKGEIIVGDVIYKITKNGTYYFPKDKLEEFNRIYDEDSPIDGKLVDDKLYQVSNGIYRFDTFYEEEGEVVYADKKSAEIEMIETKSGHSMGPNPDLNALDWFVADRTTWLGKIIQNLFGTSKTFSKYYPHTDNRRVRGSFYFYNYVVYTETGAQGWTDKKNWIGWSKTESADLRIGWHNVVLVTKLPDVYKQSMDQMQNLPTSVAPVRYLDVPGTMYKVNLKTMVIPNFNATAFDRVLTTGSTAAFNWLKSLSSENSSDWDKAQAVLVLCRTHLITVYKDQHIKKLREDSYTHVFANQIKFMISMNLADLPTSLGQYGASVLNIIKESSKMAYPTLANGDMYVAAQFDGYWQGMRIKKRQSEVISAMGLQ